MPNPPLGTTTPGAIPDTAAIDALIPPPWPLARRLMVTAVVVVLIAGAVMSVRSGLFGPQLEHVSAWGSNIEASPNGTVVGERIAPIRNTGMLTVDLQQAELPPIEGLVWLDVVGLPAVLAPGEQVEIAVRFEASTCSLDVAGLDAFPLLAQSGITPARLVDVPAPASHEPEFRSSGASGGASEDLLARWTEQPASWVLDTMAPLCLDPESVGSSTSGAGR